MKKLMVLWIVIVVAILAAGCATMGLSPEERELAREFDKIGSTPERDKFTMGLDPNHLTLKEKAKVMKEMDELFTLIMYNH